MTTLQRPVRQAQRRLWFNRWLTALGWAMATAAALFIALVVLDRLWLAAPQPGRLFGWSALGLTVAALAVSIVWSLLTREKFIVAAARLDQAAGLRERLSSGLYCQRSEDPFARAVVADAQRTAAHVTVRQHLPVRFPRSAGWAGGTLAAAWLCFWLFPSVDLSGKQEVREQEFERRKQVERTQAVMRPIVEEQLKKMAEKNPALKKDLEELNPLKDARLETPADVRRETIKKVEKLVDKLEERKNSTDIAKVEEFQKIMRRLADQQNAPKSPVNNLARSLSQGDFKGAQDSLKQIEAELSKEPRTPQEQQQAEQIQAQLQQLSDKIKQIAQDEKKSRDELAQKGMSADEIKQALEQIKNKDIESVVKKLQEKGLTQQQAERLAQQLQKRSEAGEAARRLAQNLARSAQAQKALQNQQAQQGQQGQKGQQARNQQGQSGQDKNEQSQGGQQGLAEAGQQLSDMEALQQELSELQAGMADLDALKDKLGDNCPACQGTGQLNGQACQKCQGGGMGNPNQIGSGMGQLGRGAGGLADLQETDTRMVQKRAPVNTTPGHIISQQFIDGEQFKGGASAEYRDAAIAAQRDVSDAIAREQIPRAIQKPVAEFFKRSQEDVGGK